MTTLGLSVSVTFSAVELARQASKRDSIANYQTGMALFEGFFGNASAASRSAIAALDLSKVRDVKYGVALALALAGDSTRSQALAGDLEKEYPEDTAVRFGYLPTLRARIALNRGEPSKAIEILQSAASYELGTPPCSANGFFGIFYPIYVRGEAFLAAHKGAEAARDF